MTDNSEPTPPKRRGGRPPSKKRGTFSFRVTNVLRDQLEAAAEISGRPVSEEIELRLEQSFWRQEIDDLAEKERRYQSISELSRIEGMCGGRENFEFSWFIAEQMKLVRSRHNIPAEAAINDLSEDTRRKMLADLVALLPVRFGIWDDKQSS